MKKLSILTTIITLAMAGSAFALNGASTTADIYLTYRTPATTVASQPMQVKLIKNIANAGIYSASDLNAITTWDARTLKPAIFATSADVSAPIDISYTNSAILTDASGHTATMTIKAFGSPTVIPSDPTDGTLVSSTNGLIVGASTSVAGVYNLALVPNGLVFDQDITGATWTGTVSTTIDYTAE